MKTEEIIREVIGNSKKYDQDYITQFGVSKDTLRGLRSGKHDIKNIKMPTTHKLIDAYKYKNNPESREYIDIAYKNNRLLKAAIKKLSNNDIHGVIATFKQIVGISEDDFKYIDNIMSYEQVINMVESEIFNSMKKKFDEKSNSLVHLSRKDISKIDIILSRYLTGSRMKVVLYENFTELRKGAIEKYVLNKELLRDKLFAFDGNSFSCLSNYDFEQMIADLNEKYGVYEIPRSLFVGYH